jgi:ABC-type cobalamin transport system permease subunit
LSDPAVHFVTSALAATAATEFTLGAFPNRQKGGLKRIAKELLLFGIVGVAVDIDHAPYLLGIDRILKIFKSNGLPESRPLHVAMVIASILLFLAMFINFARKNNERSRKLLCLSLGICVAVLTHYFFDYFISCIWTGKLVCYIDDPITGAKIRQILKFP